MNGDALAPGLLALFDRFNGDWLRAWSASYDHYRQYGEPEQAIWWTLEHMMPRATNPATWEHLTGAYDARYPDQTGAEVVRELIGTEEERRAAFQQTLEFLQQLTLSLFGTVGKRDLVRFVEAIVGGDELKHAYATEIVEERAHVACGRSDAAAAVIIEAAASAATSIERKVKVEQAMSVTKTLRRKAARVNSGPAAAQVMWADALLQRFERALTAA